MPAPSRGDAWPGTPFIVGIVLYPGFDLLDVAGTNEVFSFVDARLLGRPIRTLTVAAGKQVDALAPLKVLPSNTFGDCPKARPLVRSGRRRRAD